MANRNRYRHTQYTSLSLLAATFAAVAALMSFSGPAYAAEIIVYKTPWCGCCSKWVDHLKANGHTVMTKKMAGVPEDLQSCHTASLEGYVIEGHVPAREIERLLSERPEARGLAVPGMPVGSPGMEGGTPERFEVMLIGTDGMRGTYAEY